MKMKKIKIKLKRTINYYSVIIYFHYTDPKLPNKIGKLMGLIIFIFNTHLNLQNNPDFLLELLNIFSNNYLVQLSNDSFINITSGSNNNNNPLGIGSSNTGDSGPPNPNYNQLLGNEPVFEIENYKKRREELNKRSAELTFDESRGKKLKGKQPVNNAIVNQIELQNQVEQYNNQRKILPQKQIPPKGKIQIEPLNKSTSLFKEIIHKREAVRPDGKVTRHIVPEGKFFYYDPVTKRSVNPETLHWEKPKCYHNNAIRVYSEYGMTYTYNCMSSDPSKHFCRVKYPDLSTCDIYRIQTMVENIEFHRNHIKLGYEMKPTYWYNDYYNKHFDEFRKEKVNNLLERYKIINSHREIGPNTIPKDNNNNPKLFDDNSNKKLIFVNKNNYKFLFAK